jgi:hypothetical protein
MLAPSHFVITHLLLFLLLDFLDFFMDFLDFFSFFFLVEEGRLLLLALLSLLLVELGGDRPCLDLDLEGDFLLLLFSSSSSS